MPIDPSPAAHWDDAYSAGDTPPAAGSRPNPPCRFGCWTPSARASTDSVIDVGGGPSTLTDALLGRGFDDLTVLDLSQAGMRTAQQRIGTDADRVQWIVADLLTWHPTRTYHIWQDRAVFHFLTSAAGRRHYLEALTAASTTGSVAIFGCFAADGPDQCSGLRTTRYAADDLHEILGPTGRQSLTITKTTAPRPA